jgi:probable rRNA maturation factor
VDVFGADEQDAVPVEVERWVALAERVLAAEGVRGDAELSLLFVGDDVMTVLNRRFMDADGPTDVLAFPIDDPIDAGRWPDAGTTGPDRDGPDPRELPLLLGDVVVCPGVAQQQAHDHGQSLDDELALLVVHGVLHVLGHDHASPEEEAAMKAKERELLGRLHRPAAP